MKQMILKVMLVLALLGTLLFPSTPAYAHGSCWGVASNMGGVFHDTATIAVACDYTHYKSVISGYTQYRDCTPSPCGSWLQGGPNASGQSFNAHGTSIPVYFDYYGCNRGDQVRAKISSYRVYNSSLVLVHSTSSAIYGPTYTCG
jgi:hypothetical protein